MSEKNERGEKLARKFHECYERLAPDFGYETREETREFDPTTPNGRLMIAVCTELCDPQPNRRTAMSNSGEMLPSVAGNYGGSNKEFEHRCRVFIAEEQQKINPDNGLIALLCDATRLARQYTEAMQFTSPAQEDKPTLYSGQCKHGNPMGQPCKQCGRISMQVEWVAKKENAQLDRLCAQRVAEAVQAEREKRDRYGVALMMIREGCADPMSFASRVLSGSSMQEAIHELEEIEGDLMHKEIKQLKAQCKAERDLADKLGDALAHIETIADGNGPDQGSAEWIRSCCHSIARDALDADLKKARQA